jgi:hypothetical protein
VRMGDAFVWLHRVSHEHHMGTPHWSALVYGDQDVGAPTSTRTPPRQRGRR